MKIIAMIPARYDATRFPGKLMKDLGGEPVIVKTYKAAINSQLFDEVYVVTDSEVIKDSLSAVGGNVIISKKQHDCGSDRIAEAVENMDVDIVVNVQGDEPFIDTNSLKKLIEIFKKDQNYTIDLASLKVELTDNDEIENPNNVKVITDNNGFALYFSRSVIPHLRDKNSNTKYYKHKGVYAFRKSALIDFYNTPMTPLEISEKIECIRYLEVGKKIKMIKTSVESIGIDTPEDLEKAIKFIQDQI
ncbi:3-deoxy-manno-octulosonate cytidylyltransferase [Tenacibaculum xiamenense]|uniref:3-deoxy-manno-octulosonate cytidylyltransferase n=1 Tax=Tenacibaculum xiamenense TaxID=1261553 RepID=UPI00389392E7